MITFTATFRATAGAILLVTAGACSREAAHPSGDAVPPRSPSSAPASTAAAAPVAASPHEAETLVAELYREHDADRSPFFQTDSRALLDRYFETSLADLIWKDLVESKGGVGALDFDPLYDAQDVEPKNFTIHPAQADGSTVRVPVSFDSYGEKRELTYMLVPTAGAWKISDIRYANGRTLRAVYSNEAR